MSATHRCGPVGADEGVDALKVDEDRRTKWRESWRGTLTTIDPIPAADRPLPAGRADLMDDED